MQINKYQDGNGDVQTPKEDLNLPYPGPVGNMTAGAKSSGYRSNRNPSNETGQYANS